MTLSRSHLAVLAAVAAGSALTAVLAAADDAPQATVGQVAPDFELKDVYGKPFKLSDFKGKIVVLEWVNKGCPVSRRCHKQARMQELYKKYAEKVVWLGIDTTAGAKPEENRVYVAQIGITYPLLHDTDQKVGRMYGAKTTPHMFVIDADGKLAYQGAIDDDPQGAKETPVNYVAAAIDNLMAGKAVETSQTKPYGCGVKYR